MRIIKLDAIDSTNTFLKELVSKQTVANYTTVVANYQTQGRGQRSTVWTSEPSKNLMCSVFIKMRSMHLNYPFYISMMVALAIRKTLQTFLVPQLAIKWPNDILSHQKKICGVLIENVIKHGKIHQSIIGIGLNVNQTAFKYLPKATSIKNVTGRINGVEEILDNILINIRYYVEVLKNDKQDIKIEYESYLFRKNKPSTFKDAHGNLFSGYIKAVKESGDIVILVENDMLKSFSFKSISLLY